MRGILAGYEVTICIPSSYNGDKMLLDVKRDKLIFKNFKRTFPIKAKSKEQAETQANRLAKKHNGWVDSVCKSKVETIYDIKNIHLLEPLSSPVTHSTVIKMDEFIWIKRNKRIENQNKDKKDIDK